MAPDNANSSGFPEAGDIVLCTVKDIHGTTVFVNLDKYGKTGVINTSEIAPGRIRNIRDYVVPHKKIVCLVLRVDQLKGHIDLSLRRVSKKDAQEELQKHKKEQEAYTILKIILKEKAEEVADKMLRKSLSLYSLLELSKENVKSLEEFMTKDEAAKISKIISEKIKVKKVKVKANLKITSQDSNGIGIIKGALSMKEPGLIISYLGAPHYMISIEDKDYKSANKRMEALLAKITEAFKNSGTKMEFEIEGSKH